MCTLDPIAGILPDTAYDPADPWPVLRLAAGLYLCDGTAPGTRWQVDLRGARPACTCRREGWPWQVCWHMRVVANQAEALEAEWERDRLDADAREAQERRIIEAIWSA